MAGKSSRAVGTTACQTIKAAKTTSNFDTVGRSCLLKPVIRTITRTVDFGSRIHY